MDKTYTQIGTSCHRIDGIEKVTGQAQFATDLQFKHMLHARILRSPHPHAIVKRIDTSDAEKLPGIKAFASLFEVPKVLQYWFYLRNDQKKKQMFLTDSIVRFVGDPVLAIAGEDLGIVNDALSLIRVEYEVLKAIHTAEEALTQNKVSIHHQGNIAFQVTKEFGHVDKGFESSDIVVENTYHTPRQKHACLEPIGTCVADFHLNGRLTVYSSTQLPHWSKHYLSEAMGLSLNQVRIIKPFTGGAFGGRCGLIHGLEVMSSVLSRKTLRPVKMSFTRQEDFLATEGRHPMKIYMKTGATKDGMIVANDVHILSDSGAYGTHYIGVMADCLSTGAGLYRIPNYRFKGMVVYTNKPMSGAMRGYGNPQMNFAQESQMDMIAHALQMDPMELRLKNYRKAGEIDPVLKEEILSNGLEQCLEKGAASCKWKEKRVAPSSSNVLRKGIGLSIMLHGTGAARALPDPGSATIMINSDGTADLLTAAADEGQGSRTVLAQVAAEILGIDFKDIRVSDTDTDITPLDCGTHGSRQAYCGGLSVQEAAVKARQKILDYASKELNTDEGGLIMASGVICDPSDPAKKITLKHLMQKMQIQDMTLCSQIIESASGIAPAMPGYYGAVFAEVEVNMETGCIKILKLTSAYDVGRALNPEMVKGQITGGGIMGIGFALTEKTVFEKSHVMNPGFSDYRLLRSCDVPKVDPIIIESHEPTGPFGAKGIGEGALVNVASAIANAVYHAAGIRLTDLNMSPENVLRLLNQLP